MPVGNQTSLRPLRLLLLAFVGGCVCLAFASGRLRGLLLNSLWLSVGAVAIAVPAGTFLAVVISKTSLPGRRFLHGLLLAWLLVPLFVQAAAWQAALGQGGWLIPPGPLNDRGVLISGWSAAVWVHGVAGIAWVALLVAASLRTVPREAEEDALLDAAPWKVLLAVSLPRAKTGILTGALWVAVVCLGEITVTDLFQVRTFAEEVYTSASVGSLSGPIVPLADDEGQVDFETSDLVLGTAIAVCLVLVLLAVIAHWLPSAHFFSLDESWRWKLDRALFPLAVFTWLLITNLVVIPLVSLVGKAGVQATRTETWIVREWSATKAVELVARSPWEHRREVGWSFAIGASAAALATFFGILIAWALRTNWLNLTLTAVVLAILFALPGPLVGVWIIRLLNHSKDSPWAWLNSWYDNTILAPVLAQWIRTLPLATLLIWSQFASISQQILDSATSEGANWWRQLVKIVIPLRQKAIPAAFCLAFIVAVGELAATILVVPPGVSTLSVRIFGLMHYGADDQVSAICLALALATGIGTLVVCWLLGWRSSTR
ncbi:ABC transporter permease [Bythopirellula polymerisocia]|uniref:Molybdate ABC transporter permease protein n=1 Tax=Bythopirellula polymerisocia TaxID=2528003 RepID=A0A5C6CDE5_9BACT|nr:ABC transporter permease subunit [Bythopirellula polymerisocia]TWU22590.1 molybdate ABC transporter permease protein [Bythopirellula polymerisocia]